MSKIKFIEEGRLSQEEMNQCVGGKSYTNCSSRGPICGNVKGDFFTIIKNCTHKYYTCDTFMRFCINNSDLSTCSGLPSDAKGVKRPVSISESTSVVGTFENFTTED
ncbi:MAG: hypothetical protein J5606_02430 [Bacteroidales bacterium]|nr:hypothetical protein [Bacteroidales bacterium]